MSPKSGAKGAKDGTPKAKEVPVAKLREIVARTSEGPLNEEERTLLASALDTLGFLTTAIEDKSLTLTKLRSYLFGSATESSKNVLGRDEGDGGAGRDGGKDGGKDGGRNEGKDKDKPDDDEPKPKPKPKGHGRNGAEQYTGATQCKVLHATLKEKDECPACGRGKVYPLATGRTLVRVTGMAPISATVYELAQLRCNACSTIFTADVPPGVGPEKYDVAAAAMIALLKYGAGVPFNRIQAVQQGLGIPLPASTQWELVSEHSQALLPAYQELVRQAAQGDVIHTDDTTMKILDFVGERRRKAVDAGDIDPNQRVGLFTSGIVSLGQAQAEEGAQANSREIVLFFTGPKHAGENLEAVLKERAPTLAPPIHMCDALASNTAGEFEALLARCVAHGRRTFVELFQNFPEECRRVLEDLRTVYRVDGEAHANGLDAHARLALHQERSAPVMTALHDWMKAQLAERHVEPNSSLGKAIAYMLKHWEGLTLFLRQPGAPLDNNTCERALKKAVLNRKNAYFYRTQYGAEVGDLYMSLIHTCERAKTSAFEYMRTLLANPAAVAKAPSDWMPWNYAASAAKLKAAATPPSA